MAAGAWLPSARVRPWRASGSVARWATSCARAPDRASSTELWQETTLRVLITRPQADAEALARTLEALGHDVLIEPLLTIEQLAVEPALEGVQAIALTSANAVPALNEACMALPLFAVGDATAAAARRAGHAEVEQSDGDAASLARLIAATCTPALGPILHLAGTEVRPSLAEGLSEAGFEVVRQAVYRADAAPRLSPTAEAALRAGVDAVLLFSPRTARIFAGLIGVHGLAGCLAETEAFCLSAAVATACRGLAWRGVQVAARPDQRAPVELLEA